MEYSSRKKKWNIANLLIAVEIVVRTDSGDENLVLDEEDRRSQNEREEQVHVKAISRTAESSEKERKP